MERLDVQIGANTITVCCDGVLRPQAEWLLEYIRKTFGADKGKLRDGFKLQVGWSILSLREQNGELVISEPNYYGDPFTEWHDDISCTLRVQTEQNAILKLAEVDDAVPALFHDKVVLAKGCLDEKRVYLERTKGSPPGDSGWYVGPTAAGKRTSALEAIHVYNLLKLRPALLRVLALPPGYLVVFDGDEIEGWEAKE
jgi:hypothetical protein